VEINYLDELVDSMPSRAALLVSLP